MGFLERQVTEEEEPEGGSPAAAGCVVLAVVLAAGTVLWALSPAVAVLAVWGVGWGSVVWVAKRTPKSVQDAPDPAPPPLPERGPEREPLVTAFRDHTHPNRWVVTRESPWVNWIPNKEVGEP